MNLTDLRELLDERAVEAARTAAHHSRLAGVRGRVLTRRRRRATAWVGAAVVVVAGLVAAVAMTPGLRSDRGPEPGATDPVAVGFPEYEWGYHLVEAATGDLPATSVTLTWVPTTLDLFVFLRCEGTQQLVTTVTINSQTVSEGPCAGGFQPSDETDRLGLVIGRPATLTMTVTGAIEIVRSPDASGEPPVGPVPSYGRFAVAVGEAVPFDRYPFPARPSGPLPALDGGILPAHCTPDRCRDSIIVTSTEADPNRPVSMTVTWGKVESIDMVAQTPGILEVRVDGVVVATGRWWDYGGMGIGALGPENGRWREDLGLDPRPGDRVTIEIVPSRFTGAWKVVLGPSDPVAG
jgi:hypothetical protein